MGSADHATRRGRGISGLHTAYWKYIVRRALCGDKTLKFGRKPSNWTAVPDPADKKALRADIALLQAEHGALVEAIRAFPPARLGAS